MTTTLVSFYIANLLLQKSRHVTQSWYPILITWHDSTKLYPNERYLCHGKYGQYIMSNIALMSAREKLQFKSTRIIMFQRGNIIQDKMTGIAPSGQGSPIHTRSFDLHSLTSICFKNYIWHTFVTVFKTLTYKSVHICTLSNGFKFQHWLACRKEKYNFLHI